LNPLQNFGIAGVGLLLLTIASAQAQFTTTNFFNWETAPVHPVSLSPDATRLAVCNLPDDRVELFNVNSGTPVSIGSIPVGLNPVTVRFRTSSEIWVLNYISDSISVIDVPTLRLVTTLTTSNQPSDLVFAGTPQRAYVSCGQPNVVQVFNPFTLQVVTNLVIDGNRPRAMAVSADGTKVYVAIFESGNASTIIGSGVSMGFPKPNAVNFPNAPSGGLNPPPNSGTNFVPAINPLLSNTPPPRVSLIVKKNSAGRWMDDNSGDWTEFIRGTNAALTGRMPGWDMPDRDLAVINTASLGLTYATGLMNICMAIAVNPASGKIAVVGTDGMNSTRFEPVLNGTFIRVKLARVDPLSFAAGVVDLNPHLSYEIPQVSQIEREKSLGDPRGIVWTSDGSRAYVTGMGSDNLIIIDANGNRAGLNPVIKLGAGATGLALDESRNRLYVYNRFGGSLSTIDTAAEAVVGTLQLFDPTPQAIKLGRPHLYNTHDTSGLGQAACASCHVDSRFDRLAWDLGDPTDVTKVVGTNFNFGPFPPSTTNNFHPMKGPMVTQTLQDIITHEPFHWRGDRDGIEQFDGTFTNLQGAVASLTASDMQELKDFLATVRFAPNRFRQFDNSLSANLPLPGHFALGRGTLPAGAPLPNGNAQLGQAAFRHGEQDLSRHPQLARIGDEIGLQEFRIVELHACRHHRRAGFDIVEEQLRHLERQGREQVGDWIGVEPQARGADEAEPRHVIGRDRRHLGCDHAAHRVAGEDRVLETERFDHVPGVKREVEHVADLETFLAVAIARQQRRVEVILRRELFEERVGRRRSARAVQEDKRRAAAAFDVSDWRLVGFYGLEFEGHGLFLRLTLPLREGRNHL
jgi:DNA-binding beta-propeller fold protein YncE